MRSMVGVGMTPPNVLGTPKPASSVMISRILGASFGGTIRGGHHSFDCIALSLITPAEFRCRRRKLLAANGGGGARRTDLAGNLRFVRVLCVGRLPVGRLPVGCLPVAPSRPRRDSNLRAKDPAGTHDSVDGDPSLRAMGRERKAPRNARLCARTATTFSPAFSSARSIATWTMLPGAIASLATGAGWGGCARTRLVEWTSARAENSNNFRMRTPVMLLFE